MLPYISRTWWIFLLRINFCWFDLAEQAEQWERGEDVVSWKSFISLLPFVSFFTNRQQRNDKEKQMWLGKLVSFPCFLSHRIMFLIIAECVLRIFFFVIKTFSIVVVHMELLLVAEAGESARRKKSKLKVFNEFLAKSSGSFFPSLIRKENTN